MRWIRVSLVCVVFPALVGLGLAGCSDDGDQVLNADGDAEQAVAAAISTLDGTGRFRMQVEVPSVVTFLQEGEFAGDDAAATVTFTPAEGAEIDPNGESEAPTELRYVDGVAYERRTPATDGWWRVPEEQLRQGSSMSFNAMADVLRGAEEVRERDPEEIDGERVSVYEGRLSYARAQALLGDREDGTPEDAGGDDPDAARAQRLQAMLTDSITMAVTVRIDGQNRLRRMTVEFEGELPESLEGCTYVEIPATSTYGTRMDLTVFDLGADVTVAAPDPATVSEKPAMEFQGGDEPEEFDATRVETSDGPLTRSEVEALLVDAAGEELADLTPDGVPALSDADLVIRFEQLKEARGGDVWSFEDVDIESEAPGSSDDAESGPVLDTSDGGWSRADLELLVAADADVIDVDVDGIAAMTDDELVAAYEQILVRWEPPGADDGSVPDIFDGCPA